MISTRIRLPYGDYSGKDDLAGAIKRVTAGIRITGGRYRRITTLAHTAFEVDPPGEGEVLERSP
jgi:hypothetical protein